LDEDDDPKQTLQKLKTASKALKSAQRASRDTVREVIRAKRAVAKAADDLRLFEHPKIRRRKRR
jgi:ElaB/YqjD/DUF883 family membrane-anchored ribosome-binding protein